MNKFILSMTSLLTLVFLVSCGGNTPLPAPEVDAPTAAVSQPTAAPEATHTAAPEVEATEAQTDDAVSAATVSYAANVKPIFDARCIKCHGVESKKEGLDMLTYENLMAGSRNGSVLTAGDATNSMLVDLIVRGKMPNRGQKLSAEEIQIIIDWIDQGALNN